MTEAIARLTNWQIKAFCTPRTLRARMHVVTHPPIATMKRFLTWVKTMFKPRKCPKCGKNNFRIKEVISYNGHIDANTRRIICDNVQDSVIEETVCNHCGHVPERAEFGISELQEIV